METSRRGDRWPVVVAGALTFGTGALDVLALVHLGSVFASVMTGNLALLGLGIARADGSGVGNVLVAVLGYVAGVAAGSRTTGVRAPDASDWPPRVTVVLGVELVVLGGFVAGWVATDAGPDGGVRIVLLAVAAAAMGLQGAAVRGLGAPLATTYLTGTLTSLVAGAGRHERTPGATSLVAAVAGATCCGLLLRVAPTAAAVLVVLPLASVVLAVGLVTGRRRAPRPTAPRT